MEFKKYSEIENTYRIKYLEELKSKELDQGEFIIQEKAHGANFSFWIEDGIIEGASRSQILHGKALEQFSNAHLVLERYKQRMLDLYNHVVATKQAKIVTLCGELIGGGYKHNDVPRDKSAIKIQKGVEYCPHNDFYGFDIRIDGHFIPIDEANNLFETFGFIYAKTLFRGTFEQCLAYPCLFESTIYQQFNLPKIENNISEGVVIKPQLPTYMGNERVILKNKSEKFQENKSEKKIIKNPQQPLSDGAEQVLEAIKEYINENRLRNVLSKIGPVTNKDFGTIIKDFVADYMKDFEKDYPNTIAMLESSEEKKISKQTTEIACKLIRDNLQNIIDRTF